MSNVLHGTGKPRFVFHPLRTVTLAIDDAWTTRFIPSDTSIDLDSLEETVGLINRDVTQVDSANDVVTAQILSYDNVTKVITTTTFSPHKPDAPGDVIIGDHYIDLPYCESLEETFTPDFIVHKMFNGNIKTIKKGWYYSAVLDYGNYATVDTLDRLKWLYQKNITYSIYFYPRLDNPNISYKVDLSQDSFSISQRQHHLGHRLVSVSIIGLELIPNLPLNKNLSTTPQDYGDSYGE